MPSSDFGLWHLSRTPRNHSRVPSRPPLSCRTSPPLGGRLATTAAFANLQRRGRKASAKAANLPHISPRASCSYKPSCRP
ncbi:hypothetical protein FJ977_21190 [Mesorhizobium sp. B2-1-3A]|nr:hypothetical protein FJ977_21190 [Mesorhizobium sp. B2-1-3A]